MASEKQIAVNRANAQRSTGPKTAASDRSPAATPSGMDCRCRWKSMGMFSAKIEALAE
jgi:hypothetical protein